jgi:hypothetical protein
MHNRTQHSASPNAEVGLTGQQLRVIEELVGGASIVTASRAASVDRTTVHRWLRKDYRFRAALNSLHRTFYESTRARLHRLVDDAVEVVAQQLQRGDLRAALAVLRGTGVLTNDAPRFGPDDPREVRDDDIIAKGQRASREGDRFAAGLFRLPPLPPNTEG